jgi:hypothetical protein
MSKLMSRELLGDLVDAKDQPIHLGDHALDLTSGDECVILDHCPELGPESVYVLSALREGPAMSYWVAPEQLIKLQSRAEARG